MKDGPPVHVHGVPEPDPPELDDPELALLPDPDPLLAEPEDEDPEEPPRPLPEALDPELAPEDGELDAPE